jgi:hypothetical protein
MSLLLYPLLGLTLQSSIWLSLFSAFGEMIYHCNIRTPVWMGYFFQRPESHRIHHMSKRRLNCKNFSDFPLWDILNDTFENPPAEAALVKTGFDEPEEQKLTEMLLFQDVLKSPMSKTHDWKLIITRLLATLLMGLGCLQSVGYIVQNKFLTRVGYATVASPLPLVFSSYEGVETFATHIDLTLMTSQKNITVDLGALYHSIKGSYNRRNAYQVLFTHGPFFTDKTWIQLRHQVFQYILCSKPDKGRSGILDTYWRLTSQNVDFTFLHAIHIHITTQTKGRSHLSWNETIGCDKLVHLSS